MEQTDRRSDHRNPRCACAPRVKKTTETNSRLSYLDLEVNIVDGKFTTAVFDKRDGFSFHIVNFPYMDSNIPSKPAYGFTSSN